MADRLRDVLCDLEVRRRAKIDVVGDEEGAGTDRNGARGRMHAGRSVVRLPRRVLLDLIAQSLELTTSDIGEVLALSACRGALIEIDRDPELAADPFA